MLLQQCNQKFITNLSIKLMAERVIWLGNDKRVGKERLTGLK